MFSYDIVEQESRSSRPTSALASLRAPWALSVPIFHAAAAACFAGRRPAAAGALLLYATLKDDDGPGRRALACSAHWVATRG